MLNLEISRQVNLSNCYSIRGQASNNIVNLNILEVRREKAKAKAILIVAVSKMGIAYSVKKGLWKSSTSIVLLSLLNMYLSKHLGR